ncbi:MAG: CheY-like chemotaxis protein [Flavobacteriales bacterium]
MLVIPNNNSRLKPIERMLVDAGIQYLTVKDSAAAVSVLKEIVLDVIISDTDIGELDGRQLARMLSAGLLKASSQTLSILITNTHCEHIAEDNLATAIK